MALTQGSITLVFGWTDSTAPVSGAKANVTTDSLVINSQIDTAVYNRRLRTEYSLAASATQLIDLASFTDPYSGATYVLTKADGILIRSNGQPFRIEPNAGANPLPWFFGIAANYLVFTANHGFAVWEPVTFTTGSKLLLTNTGASTGTFSIVILGGT
jgi:hypothetical protein